MGKLLEKLRKLGNNPEENKIQVNLINSGSRDLKEENESMNRQEKEIENPYGILNIVETIPEFNRQQQGKGLKILHQNKCLVDYQFL